MLASLYSEAECIATGRRTTIFKAKSVTDAQHVVIKMHTKPYCTPKELARFHKEYNIGRDLHHSSHVVKYLSFIQQKDREGRPCCMVVMEDCGDSLQTKIPERGFSVQNFLQIGIQLTKGLRDIHKYGITHRDIKPSNIVCVNAILIV
jgi:serine/threonine-protein kinase